MSSRLDSPVVGILALVVVAPAVAVVLAGMIGVFAYAAFGFGNSPFAAPDAAISFIVERLWLRALGMFAFGALAGLLLGNRIKP